MNVGNPDRAFDFAQIPNEGIGLARLEFIINRMIGVHPKALLNIDSLPRETRAAVLARTAGYASPIEFYVEKLVEGISTLAAAFADKPVIVRMSDFKSNEYANLIGGKLYEPEEENPMLGFRGASRYVSDNFRDCFELECRALKKARDEMGLTNIQIMIPFVRTVSEAKRVIELLAQNGLRRGENGVQAWRQLIPAPIKVEVSGGITPATLAQYAHTGVDYISLGYLTHSVRALDLALEIEAE